MSIIVNGKLVRNNKWTGIKTVVKGLRAEQSFFDKVESVAKAENISKNELIVMVVSEYCDNFFSGNKAPKGVLFIHGDDEPELVVELKDKSKVLVNTHFTQEQLDKLGKAIENACKQGKNIKINLGDKEVRECKCGAKFSAYINDKNDIYCNKCKHEKGLI